MLKRTFELDESEVEESIDKLQKRVKLDLGKILKHLAFARHELPEDLYIFIGQLLNTCKVNASIVDATRVKLPSFSEMAWDDLTAAGIELPPEPDAMDWAPTISYALPLSLQATLYEAGSQAAAMCFGGQTILEMNEAIRSRVLAAYLNPIVNIFKGYIADKPEQPTEGIYISSGGKVVHELFVIGGAIFLVVELKRTPYLKANLAQVFAEQYSAAQMNKRSEFHKDLPVYGVLTDLASFRFYKYDPVTRTFHGDELLAPPILNNEFLGGMIPVANKIFSVVLRAYIESLEATEGLSKQRSEQNDTSTSSSALVHRPAQACSESLSGVGLSHVHVQGRHNASGTQPKKSGRVALTQWQKALHLARCARDKLSAPAVTLEELDQNAEDALKMVGKSVFATPDGSRNLTKGVSRADALEAVRSKYVTLGLPKQPRA